MKDITHVFTIENIFEADYNNIQKKHDNSGFQEVKEIAADNWYPENYIRIHSFNELLYKIRGCTVINVHINYVTLVTSVQVLKPVRVREKDELYLTYDVETLVYSIFDPQQDIYEFVSKTLLKHINSPIKQ